MEKEEQPELDRSEQLLLEELIDLGEHIGRELLVPGEYIGQELLVLGGFVEEQDRVKLVELEDMRNMVDIAVWVDQEYLVGVDLDMENSLEDFEDTFIK